MFSRGLKADPRETNLQQKRTRSRQPTGMLNTTHNTSEALRGRVEKQSLGINVVIYGPDGVGKSTQTELLAHFFRGIGMRRVLVYHHLVELTLSAHSSFPKTASAKTRIYRSAGR